MHTHTRIFACIILSLRRDPIILGPIGYRSEINSDPIEMSMPDVRLSLLRRPEFNCDNGSRWSRLRQHQAQGRKRVFESQLWRQSRPQRYDQDRQVSAT